MEIELLEKARKRPFAYLCIMISIPLLIGFIIVDYFEGDILEMILEILLCVILIFSFIAIQRFNADLLIYRLCLVLLSAVLLYSVSIGSGAGTTVYWLFPFPIVFMFFLGKNEGAVFSAVFLIILSVLLIDPFSFEIYSYNNKISIRFLTSMLFLTLISYGLQSSLEKYGWILIEKHNNLLKEKQNLEKALRENKTLSGLIPICSDCKKIRDDEGYWHQVEAYVRDHSDADFSHSICPDCVKKLYPDFVNFKKK